ncbi:MAG: DUF1772 domain-containing protein [Solirubrobacterales bacterium]|nr:DUF1772 domain-containing protein [Solirubrobacterales bacterium]
MSSAIFILTLATALGSGLVAGFFFGVSTFLMPVLGRLPAAQGIAVMQAINVRVINPWFMTALFGTALACIAVIVAALANLDDSFAPYLLAGGVIYVVATIGLTMAYNVPRNDALAALDPGTAEAARYWARYLAEWTPANHVRGAAALLACGLQIAAIHLG